MSTWLLFSTPIAEANLKFALVLIFDSNIIIYNKWFSQFCGLAQCPVSTWVAESTFG